MTGRVALALGLAAAACAPVAELEEWRAELAHVPAGIAGDPDAEVDRDLRLAEGAAGVGQRCAALREAGRDAARGEGVRALAIWARVERDGRCRGLWAEAKLRLGLGALARGETVRGVEMVAGVVRGYPESLWAREGVRRLYEERVGLAAAGISFDCLMEGLYEETRESAVAGHVLFYGGLARAEEGREEEALYLLVRLIDGHPESALWDDAVVAAADLLREAGRAGDETKLLEDALAAYEERGIDGGMDAFTGRIRLRVAELNVAQGRYEDALGQLARVVNEQEKASLKDDALWMAAEVLAELGDEEREEAALRALIEGCPWSRYVESAKARLAELKEGEADGKQVGGH
jgi:tetratricopeptide (TPR) repeat protein